jgi:diguanylate cyclase (GGDEF)-like protein
VDRQAHRDARVVGLSAAPPPTLDDVEHRRIHLWIVMMVLAVAVLVCLVCVAVWGQLPLAAPFMAVPVVGGYCIYAIHQERLLRTATRQLMSERVLVTALEGRLQELTALLDAGRAMNDVLELSEVLERILDNALDLLGASDGSVMLTGAPGTLHAVCVRGNDNARDSVVQIGHGVAGQVAATREPLLIQGELEAGRLENPPESAMSVPLVHRGELLGVLNVNAHHGRRFDEYDLRALSVFGEHAASSIANARLYEAERSNAIALAHRAYHDPLTDLGNRALFTDSVSHALAGERPRPVAVIFLDLDDFKKVNDSLGHASGDELLCNVADRLAGSLRGSDIAARLGGDEFAVLLENVQSPEDALRAAERLLHAISGVVDVNERSVTVRGSMGVAIAEPGVSTTEDLLRNADVALYIAKGQGKGCVRVFEPSMHSAVLERLELEAELEVAVERAELDVRYQPVVSLATGRVNGFEALVRWNHPERGELAPDTFIPLAEETGLVLAIDRWVLLKACCQARMWQKAYPSDDPLVVSVNLSARHLDEDNDVVELVKLALEVSGLAPEDLVVEITESFLMRDEDVAIARLEEIRALGVRLAIDDFGTGYSSLSYLRHLPIDVLKIDRSFIDGLGRSEEDTALVHAILRLARSLNLETIAEGVERPDQRAALADLNCNLAQGWHFSRPLRSQEMEDLLRTRSAALSLGV